MLNLTEEQKKIFYTGTYFHGYQMHFPAPDLTIDNDTLHSEAVTIKESICGEEEFVLGGCIASSCEFEVSEILQNELNGQEFTATLETVDEDGNKALELPMGTYRVDSAGMVDDKDYKKVVAYDALYGASADVSEWYNGIFPAEEKSVTKLQDGKEVTVKVVEYGTVKLKAMRESLLQYLGIPFESQDLINDDMDVEKTVAPSAGSLTGITVLKAICTVNGGFGRMSRQGKFEVIQLGREGLYPEETLYPSDASYPGDGYGMQYITDNAGDYPEYRSVKYEEYECLPVTCLNIQTDEEDAGVTIGTDLSNPYLITGNFLLYGKSVEELKIIGANILSVLQDIVYRPHTTNMNALPYLEPGDKVAMPKEKDEIQSYIFSRTMTGIQALTDTLEAKGNKVRANEVTQESELIQLKGRTLKIRKSIDEVSIEMTNMEKNTSTRFEQTDEAIRLEARRAKDAEGELQSSIDLQADSIVLKVDSNGKLVEVALGVDADEGKNYFKVGADNINLTADEVIDLISNGTINLSGKNINIKSDNFTVDSEGNVAARSIDIEGGKINLITKKDPTSLIELTDYDVTARVNGEIVDIKFFGEGRPWDSGAGEVKIEGMQIGDYYFDTLNRQLWQFRYGGGAHWIPCDTELDYKPVMNRTKSSMSTDGGFLCEKYSDIEIENEIYKNGYSVSVSPEKVNLHKSEYTTRMGSVEQYDLDADLNLEISGYDEKLQPISELKTNSGFSADYLKGEYIEAKSVVFNADSGTVLELDDNGFLLWLKQGQLCMPTLILRDTDYNPIYFTHKSIVRNFSKEPIPSTGILKLPADGIQSDYPVTVVNGDGEACPDLDFSNVQILPSEGVISVFVKKAVTGTARITYSYWAKDS